MLSSACATTLTGLLNDVKIMYFFENENDIDWPLIYYLVAEQGCQIELAGFSLGPIFRCEIDRDTQYDLGLSRCLIPDTSVAMIDSAFRMIVGLRAPDIVMMSGDTTADMYQAIEAYVKENAEMPGLFSAVRAMYHCTDDKNEATIFSNAMFYTSRDGEQIERLVFRLTGNAFEREDHRRYTMYRPDDSLRVENNATGTFATAAMSYRLTDAFDACVHNSALRAMLTEYAKKHEASLTDAATQTGGRRLEAMFAALDQLKNIRIDFRPTGGGPECERFVDYMESRMDRVVSAIMHECGFVFDADAILMRTSEGDILKISTSCVNNGAPDYRVRRLKLKSGAGLHDSALDTIGFAVPPYQTVRRDYAVAISADSHSPVGTDAFYIEGELGFGDRKMTFRRKLTESDKKAVKLTFIPAFRLVNPFQGEWVDHLVEMTQLKLLIEKPESFAAETKLEFITPPSVYVGTYRQEISLKAGDRSYEINLPVAIGKSAGNQRHQIMANLKEGERTLGSDRAHVLGLECKINEKLKVALVGGTEGLLEDILRMTGVGYQTVSDRYLETGYFGFYDILLLDTDCLKRYPSLEKVGDKLKQFMQNGGTIIVFGQTGQSPDGPLPVNVVPVEQYPGAGQIKLNGSAADPLFKHTYQINPNGLIGAVKPGYRMYPARVFPGEIIISAGSGAALLSRTVVGSGQLIYCGFPVLDMFADLEPLGVRFFANLINFPRK